MGSVYRVMLNALPADFRAQYGREMLLAFGDEARSAASTNSPLAVCRFAIRMVLDWLATIVRETEMTLKALPLAVVATILLLAVDWLAFHDIHEPHTVRDYLTLLASMVVFIYFAMELFGQSKRAGTPSR
jgi:hypothetical protein